MVPPLRLRLLLALALLTPSPGSAAELFQLADVRLQSGPLLDAQNTNLHYLLSLDPERLLAPFRREAGLPVPVASYGNWESSGLDGHMGGHYLSALALMVAASGDTELRQRLDAFVAELRRCQLAHGDGYLGGIPEGQTAWRQLARGQLQVDNFSLNGRWVPWYNLHKVFAGLRDAWRHAGHALARDMLIELSDWAWRLTASLSEAQLQDMLRAEHGGMNEIFADVADISGDARYLSLAEKFSQQALLQPLRAGQDQLSGLHANTQIPKVIGFQRVAALSGKPDWNQAAQFFWQTVRERRSVAIGGNSVKEHFHGLQDFQPMLNEVEGPETCNSYNMLKLTELLFQAEAPDGQRARYADFYERALYNHILSAQHPGHGGFAYFTPMRPNHYRVYSQPEKAMWCCVGSGLESHGRHASFIYAHEGDTLYVNLFVASTLNWRTQGLQLTQSTRFPDRGSSRITVHQAGVFALKIRHPEWVAAGQLQLRLNGRLLKSRPSRPGSYLELRRRWAAADRLDIRLPMRTQLEPMPGTAGTPIKGRHYAVLHGPIVLAAKTTPFPGERLRWLADDSRMGHIAQGPVCPQQSAPLFVSDSVEQARRAIKPVRGQALTFNATGLIQGQNKGQGALRLIPFFRLHDSRYQLYWAHARPAELGPWRAAQAAAERERVALEALTVDQVAPGEQQPEVDHGFLGEETESGLNGSARWRHARRWFSYVMQDPKAEARVLRLQFARADAGRRFNLKLNGEWLQRFELGPDPGAEPGTSGGASSELYSVDLLLPAALLARAQGRLELRFEAEPGSFAGGLYGLRLLRGAAPTATATATAALSSSTPAPAEP